MTDQVTFEEAEKLVSFIHVTGLGWQVFAIAGDVLGPVHGNIYANVHGDVGG